MAGKSSPYQLRKSAWPIFYHTHARRQYSGITLAQYTLATMSACIANLWWEDVKHVSNMELCLGEIVVLEETGVMVWLSMCHSIVSFTTANIHVMALAFSTQGKNVLEQIQTC